MKGQPLLIYAPVSERAVNLFEDTRSIWQKNR